jgi:hypothetical protein
MVDEKKKLKRLVLNIDPAIHKEIKIRAIDRNTTITEYVLMAIMSKMEWEKKYE